MDEDRQQFLKGMKYSEMSNVCSKNYSSNSQLVMSADKRERGPREGVNGEPESLVGKIDPREMGSRLPQPKAPAERPRDYVSEDQVTRKRKREDFSTIDSAEYEGLRYRPKGPEGRANFGLILTLTAKVIGDVSHEIIRSAADAALEILKDEKISKDFDKKKEIEGQWGTTLSQNQYTQLVQFAKRIVDYDDDDTNEGRRRDDELAEQYGVSMQVDEEDEDKMDIDYSDDEEEGEVDVDIAEDAASMADETEATVVGEAKHKRAKVDDNKVYAHEIDAFWLQRTVAAHFAAPITAQEKSVAAMNALASNANVGSVENELMEIFDFENFPTVTKLIQNRNAIVWCTRLAR